MNPNDLQLSSQMWFLPMSVYPGFRSNENWPTTTRGLLDVADSIAAAMAAAVRKRWFGSGDNAVSTMLETVCDILLSTA